MTRLVDMPTWYVFIWAFAVMLWLGAILFKMIDDISSNNCRPKGNKLHKHKYK